ncbi:MAG: hypothetical protein WC325_12710 [Candidatus Bathyarchaeia archaeon]|jgi:hypothetical protein
MKKPTAYIGFKEIHKLFQLTNGKFVRKVKWDELWHVCYDPLDWEYKRIPAKSLGGYMSHTKE